MTFARLQVVKGATIEVLMGGDIRGKEIVRDSALTTAAKVAGVVAITDAHGLSTKKPAAKLALLISRFITTRASTSVS